MDRKSIHMEIPDPSRPTAASPEGAGGLAGWRDRHIDGVACIACVACALMAWGPLLRRALTAALLTPWG